MPTELRKIIFSEEEIVRAVLSQNRRSPKKLPPGDIVKVGRSGSGANMDISIFDATVEQTKTVTLGASYLAAAMLGFCIDNKIPVPRVADKSVEVLGDSFALSISIGRESEVFEA